MKKLVKYLATISVLVLAFTAITGQAVSPYTDAGAIDSVHRTAVEQCSAKGIINGMPDGSFAPNGNVTREQMAKMIVIAITNGAALSEGSGTEFTDVPLDRWSCSYIEYAANSDILCGVGNGQFLPEDNVTGVQAAKMLLVGVCGRSANSYVGSQWLMNVTLDACTYGLYNSIEDIDVSAPLSREHAAQIIWNALQAK